MGTVTGPAVVEYPPATSVLFIGGDHADDQSDRSHVRSFMATDARFSDARDLVALRK